MILTRSPFYYNVVYPNAFMESVDFTLEIGVGTTTTPVITTTYNFTKLKTSTNNTNTWIDLSPYIRDLYTITPIDTSAIATATVIDSTATAVLIAVITGSFNDTIGSSEADVSQKFKAANGYGYHQEGQNKQSTQKILLTNTAYKADYRGYFIVPLNAVTGDSDPTVNGTPVSLSFVDGVTNYIKYLVLPCTDYTDTITVIFQGETIVITLVEECKYDVQDIQFVNRFGALEILHFYKAKRDRLAVQRKSYKNAYTDGTSYSVQRHQNQILTATGNKTTTIETGFLNEQYNDTIEEVLLSKKIWIAGVPVNCATSNLDLKTRKVDNLISYSIDFEYAYDEINNV